MLAGWGTFNLVEGIIDHHILGIHHVKAGANETALDLAFLALGAALLAGGTPAGTLRDEPAAQGLTVACKTLPWSASSGGGMLPSSAWSRVLNLGSSKPLLLFDACADRDQGIRVPRPARWPGRFA